MFTVALIGPDGAGKTTIGSRLSQDLGLPVKYIYMGVNSASSNIVLPTTRFMLKAKRALGKSSQADSGPPDPNRIKPAPKTFMRRTAASLKASLRLINLLGEEWFRQGLACYYKMRGYIVVFDRHFFFDYYAYDIAREGPRRPLARRIHGFVLNRLFPKPDMVVLLDAPAEVLFARKPEGSVALLEHRRQEYFRVRHHVKHFAVVDASRSVDNVARDVAGLIHKFYDNEAA